MRKIDLTYIIIIALSNLIIWYDFLIGSIFYSELNYLLLFAILSLGLVIGIVNKIKIFKLVGALTLSMFCVFNFNVISLEMWGIGFMGASMPPILISALVVNFCLSLLSGFYTVSSLIHLIRKK